MEDSDQLRARAWLLGTRLDLKQFEASRLVPLEVGEPLALGPLTLRAGSGGCAILFRFGAAVFFGVALEEEKRFLDSIRPFVTEPLARPESEEAEICIEPERAERVTPSGEISLRDARVERLQAVADVLAKSMVLAFYEVRVAEAFDRVEGLAEGLRTGARVAGSCCARSGVSSRFRPGPWAEPRSPRNLKSPGTMPSSIACTSASAWSTSCTTGTWRSRASSTR